MPLKFSKMDAEVLVLGAGVSGLAAAQSLRARRLTTIVLEARDRLGGRIHTVHDEGWPHPIELGAEFLHGNRRLLKVPGTLDARNAEGEHWTRAGRGLKRADAIYEEATGLLLKMGEREETPAQYLLRHHLAQTAAGKMARQFVEGFYAADAHEVSTGFLVKEQDAQAEVGGDLEVLRACRGYDALPRELARHLDVRLSSVVTRVKWKRRRVEVTVRGVTGKTDVFTAKRLVVTLPLGVLKAKAVSFQPALPGVDAAVSQVTTGAITKCLIRFREPFWKKTRAKNFTFMHADDSPLPVWWRAKPFDSNVLIGWAAGPAADRLVGSDVLAQAVGSLEKAFAVKRLDRLVEAWRLAEWATDPFALGGYLVVPAGQQGAQQQLARAIDDTVFFAGEHTNLDGHAGTVHGAAWTGWRAADEVAKSVRANAP